MDISKDRYFLRETVPENLTALGRNLCDFYNVPLSSYGIRGNPLTHFRGGHRSRDYIRNSPSCPNRVYTVSETPGNRSGGSDFWCSALDFAPGSTEILAAICQRLDRAVRAGKLEKVTEWYGNLGGDQIVDGYDNIRNALATSDSSHLMHLHMTFDRGAANDDHSDVLAILTLGGSVTAPVFDPNSTGLPVRDDVPLPDDIRRHEPKKTDGTVLGFPLAWWIQAIRLDTLKLIGAQAAESVSLGSVVTAVQNARADVLAAIGALGHQQPPATVQLDDAQLAELARLMVAEFFRQAPAPGAN